MVVVYNPTYSIDKSQLYNLLHFPNFTTCPIKIKGKGKVGLFDGGLKKLSLFKKSPPQRLKFLIKVLLFLIFVCKKAVQAFDTFAIVMIKCPLVWLRLRNWGENFLPNYMLLYKLRRHRWF